MTFVLGFGLLLLFLFQVYVFFLLKVLSGLYRAATPPRSQTAEMVSVIIAVRNEESTVGACIQSILAQKYPKESYEIIVIDDGSSDTTRKIVHDLQNKHSQVKLVLPVADSPTGNKRAAVMTGITEARGDILLFTDGDCTVRSGWISGMARALRNPTRFVAGLVVEADAQGFLQKLSRIEFLGIIGVAAGLIRGGNPIFCNGANIAYRKTAFEQIAGFGLNVHFSDDEVILQRFHARDKESVFFTFDPDTIVTTGSPRSLKGFWHQRVRWSSKSGVYENKSILARLVVLYLFFVVLLGGIVLSVQKPDLLTVIIPVLAVKFLLEWIVLHKTAVLLNQSVSVPHLFIAEVLHVPYIVLAALQGQIGSLRWKGAPVRR
ncbi:MAG: glycosyltransferase [Bacteroidota bacterium]